jgi:hypothetical protein
LWPGRRPDYGPINEVATEVLPGPFPATTAVLATTTAVAASTTAAAAAPHWNTEGLTNALSSSQGKPTAPAHTCLVAAPPSPEQHKLIYQVVLQSHIPEHLAVSDNTDIPEESPLDAQSSVPVSSDIGSAYHQPVAVRKIIASKPLFVSILCTLISIMAVTTTQGSHTANSGDLSNNIATQLDNKAPQLLLAVLIMAPANYLH